MALKVRRLPEDLVNKIAAGEVVERPASVVKELVENALDAGAAGVAVEIEAGGKASIRVRDDGSGMAREDAEAALERHATSKLRRLEDLQAVASHGFRGEALPSIASVAHLTLRTRDDSGPAGTEVEVRHGRRLPARDVGHPRGTTVEVRDLFGAVPARRKFLRADATEAGHVAEVVASLALARPDVGFTLASAGRTLIQAPAVDGLRARLYQLHGSALLEDLVPVEGGCDWARVTGFVSRPDRPAPPRAALRLFVNGRPVRDRALARAVHEAYRAAAGGDRKPEAVLFLEAPLHMVDVNVHPAKAEVRFADPATAFRAVERAVREALASGSRVAPAAAPARVAEAAAAYLARADAAVEAAPRSPLVPRRPEAASWPEPAQTGLLPAGGPTLLGQHRNTYIVASDGEELLLLDQHTAHERIRFELLLDQLGRGAVESQRLLEPLLVELDPALRPVLEDGQAALAELGLDVEPFGGGSARIRAMPALLSERDPGRALAALLRDLAERDSAEWLVADARGRIAASVACHSAVRAGQPLARETMAAIVRELGRARHPTLCPHGRPTVVRVPRDDVARWFGRAGWRRR
jgi:DNA mismatch repair protein MutL